MLTLFPAHAPADAAFAQELSRFLTAGCDVDCFTTDAAIKPGHDLIAAAGEGVSADILVLLLSSASNPAHWRRERWEPLLFQEAGELNTRVAVFLLEPCAFPPLLRRYLKFFDATANRLTAMRRLKRWIRNLDSSSSISEVVSEDLHPLYDALTDQPGSCTASGPIAQRFANETHPDFEAVFWIPAYRRTLAQIAGELGSQLHMSLTGQLADNCRRIRDLLSGKRCLLIFDAPQVPMEEILPVGRASVLITSDPVQVIEQQPTLAYARSLVHAGRFAEAYEMLYPLLHAGVETESCARELVWICEHWDRLEEANQLRFHFAPSGFEQLRLFQT